MSRAERQREDAAAREWHGSYRPYDLVKEAVIAFCAVLTLALVLTLLFSSPDKAPSTIRQWARTDPVDFVTTAASELDGSSTTAGYGPPYNHNAEGQHLAFIRLQKWLGVSHPIDAPQDFVLAPLGSITGNPPLTAALAAYRRAPAARQSAWTMAYGRALGQAKAGAGDTLSLPAGAYGPVGPMMSALLTLAQSGGLDGALLTSRRFYQTDYTKPLMLMADGSVLSGRAQAEHLLGNQWGMMNETGSYPGQVWLWLYTFWYQIKPFSTSANADILVMGVMGVLSLTFVLIPFLPGVRDLPRRVPLYRLIWREHYRARAAAEPDPSGSPPGAGAIAST